MEYPFHIQYISSSGSLIGMVDALSRAPYEDAATLCDDQLDLQYHPMNLYQAQRIHEVCFAMQSPGSQEPFPYDPALRFLYDAAGEDKEYIEIVENVTAGHEWSAYKNKPLHHVCKWGRALFESLSISRDDRGARCCSKEGSRP